MQTQMRRLSRSLATVRKAVLLCPFLQAAFVALSFSRWVSCSSREGVHLGKRKALGCSSDAWAHHAEEANTQGNPLLGLIKERFQIQTVPFQQGVLKWTFIKIRQKQQNSKSGIKLSTLKNAIFQKICKYKTSHFRKVKGLLKFVSSLTFFFIYFFKIYRLQPKSILSLSTLQKAFMRKHVNRSYIHCPTYAMIQHTLMSGCNMYEKFNCLHPVILL